jgi:glycosyltransferase involved in cell wall biosynthesis
MKNVIICLERRYLKHNDEYYVIGIENNEFFKRYLNKFDKVFVYARCLSCDVLPDGAKLVSDESIEFIDTANIKNYFNYLFTFLTVLPKDAFLILRAPGLFTYFTMFLSIIFCRKYALEIVTDPVQEVLCLVPYKVLATPIKIFVSFYTRIGLFFCEGASFVTKHELQSKYLPSNWDVNAKYLHSYSSIDLLESEVVSEAWLINKCKAYRNKLEDKLELSLLFVGALDQDFKGLDLFINILRLLPSNYIGIVMGDGKLRNHYERESIDLIKSGRIKFLGFIGDKNIKSCLFKDSDIFISCSKREGLPRVVIESMAFGLPVIGAEVSGIRELIDEDYIFQEGASDSAIQLILNLTSEKYYYSSVNNLRSARRYTSTYIVTSRESFYDFLIDS